MTILAITDTSINLNKDNNQSTITFPANKKNIPKESSAENNNNSSSSSSSSSSNSDSDSDGKNRTQDLTPGSVPLTPQRVKLLTALYERTGRGGKAEELCVRAVQEGLSSYSELGEYCNT